MDESDYSSPASARPWRLVERREFRNRSQTRERASERQRDVAVNDVASAFEGSSPSAPTMERKPAGSLDGYAVVAQPAEQPPFKRTVEGSIPSDGTGGFAYCFDG